jgi:hypothetical protein
MRPVDQSVYRAALDRNDIMKKALLKIVREGDFTAPEGMKRIAQEALDTVANAYAWDNTPLDENGIPIPPQSQKEVKP